MVDRTTKVGTVLVAAAFVGIQVPGMPLGDVAAVGGSDISVNVFPAIAAAVAITTALKAPSLVVRVPLSLYWYPASGAGNGGAFRTSAGPSPGSPAGDDPGPDGRHRCATRSAPRSTASSPSPATSRSGTSPST